MNEALIKDLIHIHFNINDLNSILRIYNAGIGSYNDDMYKLDIHEISKNIVICNKYTGETVAGPTRDINVIIKDYLKELNINVSEQLIDKYMHYMNTFTLIKTGKIEGFVESLKKKNIGRCYKLIKHDELMKVRKVNTYTHVYSLQALKDSGMSQSISYLALCDAHDKIFNIILYDFKNNKVMKIPNKSERYSILRIESETGMDNELAVKASAVFETLSSDFLYIIAKRINTLN